MPILSDKAYCDSTVHRWSLKILPVWALIFAVASVRWEQVGGLMKPISKSPASGNTFTGQSTKPAIRWTFYSQPSGIWLRLGAAMSRS